MKVSLLTGGKDPHYALGLLNALTEKGIAVDFIGNDAMQENNATKRETVVYYNLRGNQSANAPIADKIFRVLMYYCKLIWYVSTTDSRLLHVLWLNKFTHFDMTLLNAYYKILGKKLVYTAHNINIWERDGGNSSINKFSLLFMYKLVDHIFVHTMKMKEQLINDFKVGENKISTISFPINNLIPKSSLTVVEAKKRFNLENHDKVLLFFGNIAPYKGLDLLLQSLILLKSKSNNFKLLIAGRIKNCEAYWENLQRIIKKNDLMENIVTKTEYIPDESVEDYFKAADVLILPYRYIYQSGVVFLSYHFGLPVIAADVGSLKEDIEESKTGFIFKPEDPEDLAGKICAYFQSDLYEQLEQNRDRIIKETQDKYSWDKIGERTFHVYSKLLYTAH